MSKLVGILKDQRFVTFIGLLALCFLVWFAGPYIKFGDENSAPLLSSTSRLVFIIIIIVLWGFNNLRLQYKTNKKNSEFINDIDGNNDVPDNENIQSSEELKILNERFTSALDNLKKLRVKGKFNRSKALYELPWYIIIGPPGSGKTTALINSGLEFPLSEQIGSASLQGIGGTRNCDWWFTNEAVMIDTAGRYTTQDSHRTVDSSAWNGFLKLLKKNRPRRPINGAIIAISIQDLLLQTDEERSWHAKTIRNRIDELTANLGVKFPVYIMLTKCDLVSGFTEFFNDYGHYDREEVCGITFPVEENRVIDFDWWSEEYDNLINRMFDRVLGRVQQERDINRRTKITQFPQALAGLKNSIEDFLRQTFSSSRYHDKPYLRGVYFSSGTQDGTSIDRMMTSICKNYGMNPAVVQSAPGQGKSYFIGRLFKELIFSESELVGINKKSERYYQWGRRSAYISLLAVFVGTLTAWTGSIASNTLLLDDIEGYLNKYESESRRIKTWNTDLRRTLPTLNSIRAASQVYDKTEHPWLSNLGLYNDSVDQRIDELYASNLNFLFEPRLLNYIESSVRKSHTMPGQLYDNLKTYLMFNNPEYYDPVHIRDWYKAAWADSYSNKQVVQTQLSTHLIAYLDTVSDGLKLDKSLIRSSRDRLLRIPVATRIYERIKSHPELSTSINIGNYLGESSSKAFKYRGSALSKLTVPYLFTKNAYSDLDFSADSPHLLAILSDDWVLSGTSNNDKRHPASLKYDDSQLEEIGQKVKYLYLADYSHHWKQSLNELNLKPFVSISDASNKLSELSDAVYSPINRVLEVASANTQLTPYIPIDVPGAGEKDVAGKLTSNISGMLSSAMQGNQVDKTFRKLNAINRDSKNAPAPIGKTLNLLSELHSYVNTILISPEPEEAAYKAAKIRFSGAGGDIFRKIQIHAASLPAPLKKWVLDLSSQSWAVVVSSARKHIQQQWKVQVYNNYKVGIKDKYPLYNNSQTELELFDFTEFFKKEGLFKKFTSNYLLPFIKKGRKWTLKKVDGRTIGLSASSVAQLQRGSLISDVFFKRNPEVPSFTFQSKPSKLLKTSSRFVLDMGGKKYQYSHGPKFWLSHTWPGGTDAQRVSIYFEKLNNDVVTRDYEGAWAWFRLLDQSRLTSTSQPNRFNVIYSMADQEINYHLKADSVINPFTSGLLTKFRCPEVL